MIGIIVCVWQHLSIKRWSAHEHCPIPSISVFAGYIYDMDEWLPGNPPRFLRGQTLVSLSGPWSHFTRCRRWNKASQPFSLARKSSIATFKATDGKTIGRMLIGINIGTASLDAIQHSHPEVMPKLPSDCNVWILLAKKPWAAACPSQGLPFRRQQRPNQNGSVMTLIWRGD